MKFGKKLVALSHSPWAQYYVDYGHLKQILEKEESPDLEGSVASSNHSIFQSSEFIFQLDQEVEKIVLFLLEQQGQIASQLRHILQEQRRILSYPDDELHDGMVTSTKLSDLVHETALQLLHLIQFVDLNVTGIRKILKKHDKITRRKLSPIYLATKVRKGRTRGSILPPLLQEEAIAALTLTLEQVYWNMSALQDAPPPFSSPRSRRHIRSNTAPESEFQELLSSDSSLIGSPPNNIVPNTGKCTDRKRVVFLQSQHSTLQSPNHRNGASSSPTASSDRNTLAVLLKISSARKRLQQSSSFAIMLAAPMMFDGESTREGSEDDEDNDDETAAEQDYDNWSAQISNWLNLFSTFLYMTNYYIVAPSSASYAEKLGSDPSISGIIIGMTPVAALVSTVLYSWWTSYSYKSALVFASTCSLIGNLMYAMGLPANSLTYVLIGRLLNGFGSARSINRRYIADTFSKEDRTAASAAFVTAGALGMAAGPAVASALHLTVNNPLNDYWQVENAPGWFMAVVWGVYLVFMIRFFEDPVKKHPLMSPPPSESKNSSVEMSGESKNSSENMNGERRPLLDKDHQSSGDIISETLPLWRKIAVMTIFLIYFVLKLVLESSLSSASTLTRFYFGWNSSFSGLYMAALGLLMLPANLGVAYLARQYEDRELMVGMQVIMLVGCLTVLQYSDIYTVPQYIVGSLAIFVGANALEGPTMSLLSKTIPKSWSQGIFNVGFLATEAGTFGRALGDVFLTFFGAHGLQNLLNNTFGVMSVLCFLTLGITLRFFDALEPY
jgi:hypothetical protein